MGPERVQVLGQHRVGAQQAFNAHGGGEVGRLEQPVQVRRGHDQHAEHAVGAVDQRQAFLLPQLHRFQSGGGQCVGRGHQLALVVADLAFTHQGERAMGQRCQVAGAAQGAVFADHGGDAGIEDPRIGLGHQGPDAGAAGGHGGQPVEHQPADHLAVHFGTGGRRVAADQAALQLRAQLNRDLFGGQRAEAGADAVVRHVVVHQRLDHLSRRGHRGQRLLAEFNGGAVTGDGDDVGGGERSDGDGHGNGLELGLGHGAFQAETVWMGAGARASRRSVHHNRGRSSGRRT